MDTQRILQFLKDVAANNNRPWFQEHKDEYDAVRQDFEAGVAQLIGRIADFDNSVAHLSVKDCTYRFYRDTRFSPDKSPYKRHLGAYISAKGKKSLHGGYYIHLEPGGCLMACGSYWLPTNILTSFTPPQKGAGMMLEGAGKETTDKLAGILAAKHII